MISPAGSPTKQHLGLRPQPRREAQAAMSSGAAGPEQRAVQQASESFLEQVEAARRSYAFEIEQLRVSCWCPDARTAQSTASSRRLLPEAVCMVPDRTPLHVLPVLQQACHACNIGSSGAAGWPSLLLCCSALHPICSEVHASTILHRLPIWCWEGHATEVE